MKSIFLITIMKTMMNMKMKNKELSVLGIGTDIIEMDRLQKSIEAHPERLLKRLFTIREKEYCLRYRNPIPHFAVRFAAKEAVAKALGCGFGERLSWQDLEILNDEAGKPEVHCSEKANERFNSPRLLLSLSHCKQYATAVALWLAH
jgi:holo-[acyl-carrier protein] synthase